MERIQALPHQPQRDLAMRTLLWISHCMRLLSVEELQDAVAISPGAKYIDEGDIVPEALLVEYCCGLVTVDSRTQTIRLAHYSIYEYFHQYDQSSLLGVPHLFITKACLSYLEMDVCRLLFRATESPPHRGFPLLAYAAQHWGDHANMCQADDIRTEVKQFLQDTDAISAWALHGLEEYQNPEGSEPRVAPLHIVARFGLLDVYFSLSAESGLIGEDFNCKTPQGETPLIIASKYGQQAFVEFLLSGRFGVQINDLDFSGRSSLLWAVINGHLGVVKALATNPLVDVNEGYPLLAAVKAREVDICAVLIKRDDLDMNATNNDGDTVFSLLLLGDSLNADLARVLLERVDLDPRQQRAENMIWMLQKDEDIMTNEELETLPLVIRRLTTLCVRRSHLENTDAFLHWFTLWICGSSLIGNHSVILLGWLNEGFEYTASDEMGFNLLHAAVISDNVELLKKALELGLSPNDATKDGETALHLATRLGHDAITLFLLSNAIDINVNAMDNEGWTPLLSTPETGREVTLRMLLESGAEANQVDDKGQSPLLFTAWNGNSDAMLLLTEHGADINRGGPGGWSPLHAAAFKKHLNVCRILVEHGAEVDRNSKLFGTPLGVAAEVRVANIVELLVQHGADPTKLGPYGRTPLEWACSYEPVFRAMGPACLSYQPTPKARAMMVLRETIGNILEELVDGAPQYGVYNVLGHTLSYLGNHQDAITAYKMAASWDHDADVFHGGFECTVCSTIMVGVRWICEVCPAVDLCSSCFAKRPIGNSTSEGAKDVTNSIPWCTSDHDFIEVPSPACVRLSKASAADKGASKAWLQSIWEKYPREAERST